MWGGLQRVFASQQMPVVLGRSPQATFCVDDSRVSRSHARVDWHSGSFQLTDLSYNGTYVRFNDGEIVSLRRGSCTLHGSGTIGLGGSPSDPGSACVSFDVLRFAETQPQVPAGAGADAMRIRLRRRRPHQQPALRRDLPLSRAASRSRPRRTAAEALDLVQHWAPDLLVIDLHLPDLDGYALLPALRSRLDTRPPAYLCTADEAPLVEAPARAAGFDGCWPKPVRLQRCWPCWRV